jgi:hypothetical protein
MSQGLKYFNEENMEEIIISYTYHTGFNILRCSKYDQQKCKYPETHKPGIVAVQNWLKLTYKKILTDEFFDSLAVLEDARQREKLESTKVHKVFEAVMKVQEIREDPMLTLQKNLSGDGGFKRNNLKRVLEKVEPNQEKGKAIYKIFNRVWYDVMSQC